VQTGEVIAKVKVIPDMAQLSSAESRVRLSDINLRQTETDFKRMESLHEQKLVSDEEFEKSRQQLRQAREEKAAADDALQVVRDGVSKSNASASSTLIRSTISGVILDVPVKVGNSVINSNTFNDGTTIATVANMQDLIFRGNIDETEVGQLTIGMPMKITIGALQDLSFDATLEYVSPKAIETNGANQFEIKAAVTIPKGATTLRSGYSANAEIVLAEVREVLSVPESAISFEGDSTYVYVLADSIDKKLYERTPVTTGLSDGVNIEIKKGVTDKHTVRGPQIITDDNKED
jgi:HlyD family secretion protein